MSPTVFQRASTERSAFARRSALSLEKAISMGLKSGRRAADTAAAHSFDGLADTVCFVSRQVTLLIPVTLPRELSSVSSMSQAIVRRNEASRFSFGNRAASRAYLAGGMPTDRMNATLNALAEW